MNALERFSRRRRERRTNTQPDHPFAVEACEHLTDGAFALLRVSGTGSAAPVALVTQGESPMSFDPLPAPEAGTHDGVWRIAFAVPAELVEAGSRLWLHDGGVYLADLVVPPPARPAAQKGATSEPEAVEDPRARKLVEAWSEAASLREKLSDREEELAEALKELLTARKDPLRERTEQLADELADARAELDLVHEHSRETRRRATETAAELDDARAELAAVEPRVGESERVRAEAEQEVAGLRQQVERLEQELVDAVAERTRLTSDATGHQEAAEKLRSKLTKLEASKSRRSGFGRRSDDRAVQKMRAELEAQMAERQQRIEQLEKEAESFAARRDEAVSDSVQQRIGELEDEVRQQTTCNEDLRALLQSEREMVAAGRREVHELKQQLATASANASLAAEPPEPVAIAVATSEAEAAAGREPISVEPPPWSALDDELLARIEKAKSLTG